MTVIPLLTVPVLFAFENLFLTLLILLGNLILVRFLWKRLTSNQNHDNKR